MPWRSPNELDFRPNHLYLGDDRINKIIVKYYMTFIVAQSTPNEFTAVVGLQDTWWSLFSEDRQQSKGNCRRTLSDERDGRQFLYAMINVVQEILEFTIGHTLKIDQIDLTANSKTIGDYVFDPSYRLPSLHPTNALRAAIGEHLADFTGDVIVKFLGPL